MNKRTNTTTTLGQGLSCPWTVKPHCHRCPGPQTHSPHSSWQANPGRSLAVPPPAPTTQDWPSLEVAVTSSLHKETLLASLISLPSKPQTPQQGVENDFVSLHTVLLSLPCPSDLKCLGPVSTRPLSLIPSMNGTGSQEAQGARRYKKPKVQ